MSSFVHNYWQRFGIAALGLLLAACSHAPTAQDVPQGANFVANILDNGTKLFTFSTRLPHLARDDAREENTVRRGDGEQGGGPRLHADLAQTNKKALQAMLLENGYCREGYVLLELYEERTNYVIRGECRDGANDADRARYTHR